MSANQVQKRPSASVVRGALHLAASPRLPGARLVSWKRRFLQRSTRHIWLCFLCTSMPTYSRAGLLCLRPRLREVVWSARLPRQVDQSLHLISPHVGSLGVATRDWRRDSAPAGNHDIGAPAPPGGHRCASPSPTRSLRPTSSPSLPCSSDSSK